MLQYFLSVLLICFLESSDAIAAQKQKDRWVPFDGDATESGPVYVLKGRLGGEIVMDKKGVRIICPECKTDIATEKAKPINRSGGRGGS